jgi:uncharacterized protein with FMN-binding domain
MRQQPVNVLAADSSLDQASRIRKMLFPALSVAAVGLLLTGCSGANNTADTSPSVFVPENNSTASEDAMVPSDSMTPPPAGDSGMAANDSPYKDGTYSATGNYTSPAGAEQVDVTLTIANGVITDTQFTGKAVNPVSQKRQQAFAEGYEQLVVGKSVDEVSLSVVNGSSLAPKGFMDAVQKIKVEARA